MRITKQAGVLATFAAAASLLLTSVFGAGATDLPSKKPPVAPLPAAPQVFVDKAPYGSLTDGIVSDFVWGGIAGAAGGALVQGSQSDVKTFQVGTTITSINPCGCNDQNGFSMINSAKTTDWGRVAMGGVYGGVSGGATKVASMLVIKGAFNAFGSDYYSQSMMTKFVANLGTTTLAGAVGGIVSNLATGPKGTIQFEDPTFTVQNGSISVSYAGAGTQSFNVKKMSMGKAAALGALAGVSTGGIEFTVDGMNGRSSAPRYTGILGAFNPG